MGEKHVGGLAPGGVFGRMPGRVLEALRYAGENPVSDLTTGGFTYNRAEPSRAEPSRAGPGRAGPGRAGSPGRRVAGSPGRRVAHTVRASGHERARIAGPRPPAGLPA